MSILMHTVQVPLGDRSYPIYIGRDLLRDVALLRRHIGGQQVAIVSNDVVAPLYLDRLCEALDDRLRVLEIVLPDGEAFKDFASLQKILDAMLEARLDRSATVLALGGGVVGDMAGFAAACYQRGIAFIQLPTTLLSQVDSSVGGKTGINHRLGKNLIGAFHQPSAVLADMAVLHSLPPREYAAGLAEVVKYGLIGDRAFYEWLLEQADRLQQRDESVLAEAVERSCAAKARIVAADEREGGVRALLNFGHTFGHAIELVQGYGDWLHGEAVATGMVLAARVSAARGWLPEDEVARLSGWLEHFSLPTAPPDRMTPEGLIEAMARDKKALEGRLRFILLRALGDAVIVDDVSEAELGALFA